MGVVEGLCGQAPGLTPGYSIALYPNGRIVLWNVVPRRPFASRPHATPAALRELVSRARRDHFFSMPSYTRDTTCAGASTLYVRIDYGPLRHKVEVYGYLPNRHPQLADLLAALTKRAGI